MTSQQWNGIEITPQLVELGVRRAQRLRTQAMHRAASAVGAWLVRAIGLRHRPSPGWMAHA